MQLTRGSSQDVGDRTRSAVDRAVAQPSGWFWREIGDSGSLNSPNSARAATFGRLNGRSDAPSSGREMLRCELGVERGYPALQVRVRDIDFGRERDDRSS